MRCSNTPVPTPISSSMYTIICEMPFLTVPFRVLPPLLQVALGHLQHQTHSSERCYPVPRKLRSAPIPRNPTTRKEEPGRTGGIRSRANGTSRRSALTACQGSSARSFGLCTYGEIASPAKRMKVPGRRSPHSQLYVGAYMPFRYVLSNRFLFKLALQPPADMVALLRAFSSTPAVVKRRAKELLDVIRGAVKKGLSGTVEEPKEHLPTVSPETTVAPSKMDVDVSSAPSQPVPQPTSVWSSNETLPIAATSSLFGSTIQPSLTQPLYSTSSSSLFGSLHPTPPTANALSRFQYVVNKIHSALVIAPTV